MNSVLILILIVSVFASNTQAFSLFQKCPPVKPVDNFDAEKVNLNNWNFDRFRKILILFQYSGKWFEIQRGPLLANLYELLLRCVQAEYRVIDKNNVELKNGGYIL